MKLTALLSLGLLLLPGPAGAEYRVALLIGDEVATGRTAGELSKLDFRCERSPLLTEKELRRKFESWTSHTPTNSTALVYFAGEAKRDKYNGKPVVCLMGSNDRPVAVAQLFEFLTDRGGSTRNIVVVDGSADQPEFGAPLPSGCSLLYGKNSIPQLPGVSGRGSIAISPPGKFVPGKQAGDEWVNSRGMVFCWCPPGKFTAGSPEATPGRFADEAQREVDIEQGFWIGKYELTDSQSLRNRDRRSIATQKNHPVNMLHWDDGSRMFTRTLTEGQRKLGYLPAGWQYHLPGEQQWEYAARAGTTTRFYFGDDLDALPEHANFADKSYYDSGDIYSNAAHRRLDDGFVKLAPVGAFKPNPWGLHDIYGNVTEWCRDLGARGGSWASVAENCRSAYRDRYSSRNQQDYLGYRVVIQPNVPEPVKNKPEK